MTERAITPTNMVGVIGPPPGIDDVETESFVRADRFHEKEHCHGCSGHNAERREYAGQAHGPDHVAIEVEAAPAQRFQRIDHLRIDGPGCVSCRDEELEENDECDEDHLARLSEAEEDEDDGQKDDLRDRISQVDEGREKAVEAGVAPEKKAERNGGDKGNEETREDAEGARLHVAPEPAAPISDKPWAKTTKGSGRKLLPRRHDSTYQSR